MPKIRVPFFPEILFKTILGDVNTEKDVEIFISILKNVNGLNFDLRIRLAQNLI
jgi:hypothetical protein